MSLSKELNSKIEDIVKKFNKKNKKQTLKKLKDAINKDNPKPRTETVRYSTAKKMFKGKTDDKNF